MNRFKSKSLGDESKELRLNSPEPGQNHLLCFTNRWCKGPYTSVRRTKNRNALDLLSRKKQIVRQLPVLNLIPDDIRLFFHGRGIHHGSDNERLFFRVIIELQCNMCRQFSYSLIRPIFTSGLAADIGVQCPLSLFMSGLVEVGFRTCHDKLYSIQYRRFSRSVLTRNEHGIGNIDRLIFKSVPIDQPYLP